MSKFRKLEAANPSLDALSVGELQFWKGYWMAQMQRTDYVKRRGSSVKMSLKKIHEIEKALARKGEDGSAETEPVFPETLPNHGAGPAPTQKTKANAGRIMYIERKAGSLTGPARIGRVTFSKTGRTLYYRGQRLQSLKGAGFKANYQNLDTGEDYWISGPKRNGRDALYNGNAPVKIDEDVREEYWRDIRKEPGRVRDPVAP